MARKKKLIVAFLAFVVAGAFVAKQAGKGKESTDDAFIEARATPIGSRVAGYVESVSAVENGRVKKGDVLLRIDSRDYRLKADAARAALKAAEVAARNAEVDAKRKVAIGKIAGAQRDIDDALAKRASADADVDSAKAMLAIAEKDAADTTVTAPSDGVVAMKSAEVGQYLAPGRQVMAIVGVERWVEANFKEVQLADIRVGQKVQIKIDAYPDLILHGRVDSVQAGTGARFSAFPPQNATGNFVKIVQRVPVKIAIDDPLPENVVLGAGMSVVPTVYTSNEAEKWNNIRRDLLSILGL